jgi:hypothetical protein
MRIAFLLAAVTFWSFSFAMMSEETILARYGDRIFRTDPSTLCILTLSGDTVVFRDRVDMEFAEDFALYRAMDYLEEQEYWVIEMSGYEWMEWYLIDSRHGSVDTVIAPPIPSPDGTRFACVMEDITACFIYNGLQVWRVVPDGLVLEFEDVDVPWGPQEPSWEGDSTIVFEKHTYDPATWDDLMRPGSLELSPDGTWIPDDPADWEY